MTATARIHSLDAARGLQRSHAKLARALDRVYNILPADFRQEHFIRITQTAHGNHRVSFSLSREALPLLFLGEARKLEILWTVKMIQEGKTV